MEYTADEVGQPGLDEEAASPGDLLVIVSGSSVAMLFPAYLLRLKSVVNSRIKVLLTKSAEQFVRPEAIGWLSDDVVTCETPRLNPVELAMRSSAIVVLPATANLLATVALGLATSPATTALLASRATCLFFPHMNAAMWEKEIVQQHVATLRSWGHQVVDPEMVDTFEIWRGKLHPGRAMPTAETTSNIIVDWLAAGERVQGANSVANPFRSGGAVATC